MTIPIKPAAKAAVKPIDLESVDIELLLAAAESRKNEVVNPLLQELENIRTRENEIKAELKKYGHKVSALNIAQPEVTDESISAVLDALKDKTNIKHGLNYTDLADKAGLGTSLVKATVFALEAEGKVAKAKKGLGMRVWLTETETETEAEGKAAA